MIGGNDLIYLVEMNGKNRQQKKQLVLDTVHLLEKSILHLIKKGAQHIIISNIPQIAFTPRFKHSPKERLANHLTILFNKTLNERINVLNKKYMATVDIKLFDLNQVFLDYIASVEKSKKTLQPCIQDIFSSFNAVFNLRTFLVGGFPVKYLGKCNTFTIQNYTFFDSIHPTAGLHKAGSRYAHEKFWASCPQNSFA